MFSVSSVQNLSPQDLKALIDQDAILLWDVREANEWAQGHIEGAKFMPLSELPHCDLPELGDKPLVTQCAGGIRSLKAAEILAQRGLKVGAHLDGGLKAWLSQGFDIIA